MEHCFMWQEYGLKHNPCQGCEGYYTRQGFDGECALERGGFCRWIKLYDRAVSRFAPFKEGESMAERNKDKDRLIYRLQDQIRKQDREMARLRREMARLRREMARLRRE